MEQLSLFIFYNFMFGTEKVKCQKNSKGWMVGVWDGLSLDQSKLFSVSVKQSKQNPNKRYGWRCNVFLPNHPGKRFDFPPKQAIKEALFKKAKK